VRKEWTSDSNSAKATRRGGAWTGMRVIKLEPQDMGRAYVDLKPRC
jgi:hypothetical protein